MGGGGYLEIDFAYEIEVNTAPSGNFTATTEDLETYLDILAESYQILFVTKDEIIHNLNKNGKVDFSVKNGDVIAEYNISRRYVIYTDQFGEV